MSPNTNLAQRTIDPHAITVSSGTTLICRKDGGAIIGLIVIPSVTANLTFHVSMNGSDWYAITPPTGDFTGVTSAGKAFPADWLAFLAPYPWFRITFSASQTGGATVHMPVMA